jgi:hypothetical protein
MNETTTNQGGKKVNDKKYLLKSNRGGYYYGVSQPYPCPFTGELKTINGFFEGCNKDNALRLTKQEAIEAWNSFEPTNLEVVEVE